MTSAGPGETIWHYDGASATRHYPRVDWDAHGLVLSWATGRSGPHGWADIETVSAVDGRTLYGLRGRPGWRLAFAQGVPADFAAHLPPPARYGRWIDHVGLWSAVAAFTLIAAATVLVVLRAPGWIAPYVPRSWEAALGDAMFGDFGGRLCETPASRAALARLTRDLAGDTPVRQVAIANIPMMNAVTLPGGRILIFRKLIEESGSPDELAGVLAHEIGHVRHRDTVTALVRQLGLGILLGGADSQITGALNGLLAMSYSRAAERAADAYSVAALDRAGISPVPTARFFDKLGRLTGGERVERAQSWMASHPVSADRRVRFEQALVKGRRYRPALDAAQWQALRTACRDDKQVRAPGGFGF
jgi:beta-barrel assembly-enhancing protease